MVSHNRALWFNIVFGVFKAFNSLLAVVFDIKKNA